MNLLATLVTVYVVNRKNNASVAAKYSIQFEPVNCDDLDTRRMIHTKMKAMIVERLGCVNDEIHIDQGAYWGLNHSQFPTLCAVVRLADSLVEPAHAWYAMELPFGVVLDLLEKDKPKDTQ